MSYFGNLDPDAMMAESLRQMKQTEDMQAQLEGLTGSYTALDGLVTAEARGNEGLTSLVINPRAMRTDSVTLSEAVLEAARGALNDLQSKMFEGMREVLGDEMMDIVSGQRDPAETTQKMEDMFRSSTTGVMDELEKLRRQMEQR